MARRDYWLIYDQQWPDEWLIHVIDYHKGADDHRVVSPVQIDPPDLTDMEYLVYRVESDQPEIGEMSADEILDCVESGINPDTLPLVADDDQGLSRTRVEQLIKEHEEDV